MAKKAVYNNQYLGIYITGADLEELLKSGQVFCSIYIGRERLAVGAVFVAVDEMATAEFSEQLRAERAAMLEIQRQFYEQHPDYHNSDAKRQEARRAKKRRRARTDRTSED